MNIVIAINTDNAAFEDSPEWETARILRDIADRIQTFPANLTSKYTRILRDVNGNEVGSFSVKE